MPDEAAAHIVKESPIRTSSGWGSLNIKKKNFWADEIFKNLSFVANK